MKNKKLISSIAPLKPTQIIDLATGEIAMFQEHNKQVYSLINFVQKEVVDFYKEHKQNLENDITADPPKFNPAEWARQKGYKLNINKLPKNIKAKSRISRIFSHKLISEVSSYVNNSNPRKQKPNFSLKINLGAVDNQMASLSIEDKTLTLRFKVWEKDYLLDFEIPDYILKRNIKKWSLPTIEIRNGEPYYIFSIQEIPVERKSDNNYAGLDLGRKEPFSMVVVNKYGNRVADYKTSGRIRQLNDKRERLLKEKKNILIKADHYDKLGLDSSLLRKESRFKSRKALILGDEIANQVGADVTKKLLKHDLNILAVEDLRWVSGRKYGSKWAHSKTQNKMEHSLSRVGIKVKKVNSKNTSQECHLCGSVIVHNSKTRIAKCSSCKEKFDRDFNAAMNVAKKLICYPAQKRRSGNDCSSKEQIIEKHDSHNSDLRNQITTMVT